MDRKGLRDYVGEHLRDKVVIKDELQRAFKYAYDPATLVLDSMDGVVGANATKKEGELRKMKRASNVLFQQLRIASPNSKWMLWCFFHNLNLNQFHMFSFFSFLHVASSESISRIMHPKDNVSKAGEVLNIVMFEITTHKSSLVNARKASWEQVHIDFCCLALQEAPCLDHVNENAKRSILPTHHPPR
ncbi:Frigida-like [Sesbania bispinosa]|nr:Frigida-like [Sesbania bispinosa]